MVISIFIYPYQSYRIRRKSLLLTPEQARIQEFTLVWAPGIGEGSGDRQVCRKMLINRILQMLQQTFFLLLNVSFLPGFLSLSLFFIFLGGCTPGAPPPESAPAESDTKEQNMKTLGLRSAPSIIKPEINKKTNIP